MKAKILLMGFICLFLLSCSPEVSIVKLADIVLDGKLSRTYTAATRPQFEGYVKNIGNNTAYNCRVIITCYSNASKVTIIDTALGFPAGLENIGPDQRVYFNAIAFNCWSHNQIKAYDINITWIDR